MKNENTPKKEKIPFFGIGFVAPYFKKYIKLACIMIGCGLIGSLTDIILPLFREYSLNHYVGDSTLDTIVWFIILYLITVIAAGIANYVSCYLAMRIEVTINKDLRNDAFNHLQNLSFSYFDHKNVGYIHARVMSDTSRIGSLMSWSIMDCVWHISYLVGVIIVMFIKNPKLAALVITIMPISVILFSVFQKKLLNLNREIREMNSKITGDINEGIIGAKTIKTLVIEDKMEKDFTADTAEMRKKAVHASRYRALFSATMHFTSSLALAIVLWKGGVIAREEVGTFSVFMSYAQGVTEPVRWIVDAISDFISTRVNIERFHNLMTTESDVKDTPEVIEKYGDMFNPKKENWEEIRGDIEFRDVTFRYPTREENILEHFNLKIPYGTNVAIVGETGAGKSTLVNLVCRFYEPTEGELLIDGKDVRERSQLWLHSSIGYVLQSPHLFSGSVRENLKYGNPNATDEQINEALKIVAADGIIEKLEKGLDTDVGEGGDNLSTGEKQLICIARAILADPKILVLDEATANVDTITEQHIQNAIDKVIRGRTSLVIAHRLSTVKNADIILVVKDGEIVESGKHRELLANHGYYYSLYSRQYEDEKTSSILN